VSWTGQALRCKTNTSKTTQASWFNSVFFDQYWLGVTMALGSSKTLACSNNVAETWIMWRRLCCQSNVHQMMVVWHRLTWMYRDICCELLIVAVVRTYQFTTYCQHEHIEPDDISLLEQQMTNANVSKASTIADTAINTVNQGKQNRHRGIKERLQRLFGHIGSE